MALLQVLVKYLVLLSACTAVNGYKLDEIVVVNCSIVFSTDSSAYELSPLPAMTVLLVVLYDT